MSEASPEMRREARRALRLDDESLSEECELEFFVAGGPGGQHRNRSATAVRLRHLPTGTVASAKERRSQAQNRSAALERLRQALRDISFVPKPRRATKPTAASRRRRLEAKKKRGEKKAGRKAPPAD